VDTKPNMKFYNEANKREKQGNIKEGKERKKKATFTPKRRCAGK